MHQALVGGIALIAIAAPLADTAGADLLWRTKRVPAVEADPASSRRATPAKCEARSQDGYWVLRQTVGRSFDRDPSHFQAELSFRHLVGREAMADPDWHLAAPQGDAPRLVIEDSVTRYQFDLVYELRTGTGRRRLDRYAGAEAPILLRDRPERGSPGRPDWIKFPVRGHKSLVLDAIDDDHEGRHHWRSAALIYWVEEFDLFSPGGCTDALDCQRKVDIPIDGLARGVADLRDCAMSRRLWQSYSQ